VSPARRPPDSRRTYPDHAIGGPLRVGVIGLGNIAQKAYLPVLAARADVELTLMSRDPDRVARIGRQYRVSAGVTDLGDLLGTGIDVAFVHASTNAHFDVVRDLLSAGVHVLVDKPLAPSLHGAQHLVDLAERHGRSLVVGFNRRYAPAYAPLAELSRSVVLMQKNRVGLPDEPRRLVFDDFIHVVDTMRFLMPPGEEQIDVHCSVADGLLHTVTLGLHVGDVTGFGVMHRVSGSNEEVLEVLGDGHKHRVVDLAETWWHEAKQSEGVRLLRRADWTPVHTQRGFTAMCAAFLDAVRAGRILSARDALRTHEVCEDIVRTADAALAAPPLASHHHKA
jgi:virulence factor